MKAKIFLIAALPFCVFQGYFCSLAAANGAPRFDLSIQAEDVVIRCQIDEKPVDVKMSSDGDTVIVSGTRYIPVSELNGSQPSKVIHVRKAPPHVDFLSDFGGAD